MTAPRSNIQLERMPQACRSRAPSERVVTSRHLAGPSERGLCWTVGIASQCRQFIIELLLQLCGKRMWVTQALDADEGTDSERLTRSMRASENKHMYQ